jgi:pimeloyl-ACP methyl ester carboxylesterase
LAKGKKLLLAFHGYRNNASLFTPFLSSIKNEYTIISFDLPHHGSSKWNETDRLHPRDLKSVVLEIMKDHQVEKVALMGYSMGGRVCLKIAEMLPGHIDRIVLLAPDGLVLNPTYYFATRTKIGSVLFRKLLTNPDKYMGWIKAARDRKIISESKYRFALNYISGEPERMLLLKIWPAMSLLLPNAKRLKAALNEYDIPVHVYMGKHDHVIPVSLARQFEKGLKNIEVHVLEKGHRVFDYDTIPFISESLLK